MSVESAPQILEHLSESLPLTLHDTRHARMATIPTC
jgi:hypothetical protein